ncbi:MAG: hypothetical protein QXN56_03275 [Candidatus Hadarchaeum sp.]
MQANYTENDVVQHTSLLEKLIDQVNKETHLRLIIHGCRCGGKSTLLKAIENSAERLSKKVVAPNEYLEKAPNDETGNLDETSNLILFDDIDVYPNRIIELSKLESASIILTAPGRFRPSINVRGLQEEQAQEIKQTWEQFLTASSTLQVPLFTRTEIEALVDKALASFLQTQSFHRDHAVDTVIYLSNGHPFLAQLALDLIRGCWEKFVGRGQQALEDLIYSGDDEKVNINRFISDLLLRLLNRLEKPATMMLTLIAVGSGLVPELARYNDSYLGRRVMEYNQIPSQRSILSTDALMMTYDAQEWLAARYNILEMISALNEIEDEVLVTYDDNQGWQLTPIVAAYFKYRGVKALKDLELENDFRRWVIH